MPWPVFWKGGSVARTNVNRSMSDSLTLSGASVVSRTVRIETAAALAFSDNLTHQEDAAIQRTMTDSLTLSAASVVRRTVRLVRAASLVFSDNLTHQEDAPVQRSMTDSLTLAAVSVITRTVRLVRAAALVFSDDLTHVEDDQTPAAPTSLDSQDGFSSGDIDLSWNDIADNEDNYEVQRREYPGPTSYTILTSTLPAGTEAYTDTTSVCDVLYDYRVRATNSRGDSGFSNVTQILACDIE